MTRFVHLLSALWRASAILAIALGVFVLAPALRAQDSVITLDPATTEIDFTLAATLHTVHGTFKLKSGQIQWDSSTGRASGSIVIDATSGNTDNASRDKNMHTDILESGKFPEITFTPGQIKGAIPKEGTAQIDVEGVIRLHGQDHDATLACTVQPGAVGSVRTSMQLVVPYVKWGLKNPSTFLLHVGDTVNVDIHATARIAPSAAH